MKETKLFLLVVLAITSTVLCSDDNIEQRLQVINKPAIKTFRTKYGDIVDCVRINKQFAFDHPLLKNHSIQMKPNFKVSIDKASNSPSSELLPKMKRCPIGTVPIKRIQHQDLGMPKLTSFLNTKSDYSDAAPLPAGHQIATLVTFTKNIGASGQINLWSPDVAADQFSSAAVFVSTDDASVSNAISAGWMVNPTVFEQNGSRLFGYWTKDSGESTGCYNTLCPGFVQISKTIYLGSLLQPVSTYAGNQTYVLITIQQDQVSKNWWLLYGENKENVGYWPNELFSSLSNGATRAGWGGEIWSPIIEATPAMGSGHFPKEGFKKTCVITQLKLVGQKFPGAADLKIGQSKPDCYKAAYGGDIGGQFGNYMAFGGPSNCTL